ncbi:tetratricopeptide repeat protein [candidate division WOR-3 bacterium]|nr:tetratricopeptide repeat protein [candidate division WOR-3 bacterium]
MILKTAIQKIEKEKFSFLLGYLTVFSIILIRNILESSFEGKQLLGFSVIPSHSFFMTFVHFPLFYISLFTWIILIFKLLTGENTIKIAKTMTVGMTVIIIAPLIDIIASKGSGYKLTYLTGPETITEIHKFFYFTKDLLQASWGQRLEISLVLIGSFYYVFIKTKKYFISIIAPIIVYMIIFIHSVLPNTIAKIPLYLGFKNLTPKAILTGGIFSIDSQNYSVIFSLFTILACVLTISIEKKDEIKKVFNLKSSSIAVISVSLGIIYGLFLIFRYYPFILISPIFYLSVFLSIIIAIFINKISQLEINTMGFQLLAIAIILSGFSFGYIFLTLILISYIVKRFLKPDWIFVFPIFIAGFSLIFQETTFKTIIPLKNKNVELKGKKLTGWTFFLNGDYNKALLNYLKANSISYNIETQKRIGQCYLNTGNLEKSAQELQKIKNPDYETFLSLGRAYEQNGKNEKAINIYKKAIEEVFSPEEFYVKIAQVASKNVMESEMNEAINKAFLLGTPKHKLYQIKADFYFRKGNLEDAMSMYNNSLAYNPRSSASLTGKGMTYYRQGKNVEAEEQLLKALEIEPNNDAIYNNMGVIYIAKNEYEKAEKTFLKSLKINPNQEEAYYNLGLIYEITGDKPQALKMYQKALNVNPDYLPAKLKIKLLKK